LALKYINKLKRFYSHCDQEAKIKIIMIKAEIQYHMGDLDSSLNNFQKAYTMGDNDKSLCYISQIYFDKNQPMQAMKYLRKVLHIGETNKEEFWQNMEKLNFEELKISLRILLNRFEISKNKIDIDSDLYERIQEKLYPEENH
jgi:tetratricopeptide (TPR) repeat protein